MFTQPLGGSSWRVGFFRRFGGMPPRGRAAVQAWRLFAEALCNALRAPHC